MKNAGNYKVKEHFNPSIARQGKREIVQKTGSTLTMKVMN